MEQPMIISLINEIVSGKPQRVRNWRLKRLVGMHTAKGDEAKQRVGDHIYGFDWFKQTSVAYLREHIPRGVIIQLEERDSEELHVLGDSKDLFSQQKHKARGENITVNKVLTRKQESTTDVMSVLRSGICTIKSFLHSLGLVMCAGTKGY